MSSPSSAWLKLHDRSDDLFPRFDIRMPSDRIDVPWRNLWPFCFSEPVTRQRRPLLHNWRRTEKIGVRSPGNEGAAHIERRGIDVAPAIPCFREGRTQQGQKPAYQIESMQLIDDVNAAGRPISKKACSVCVVIFEVGTDLFPFPFCAVLPSTVESHTDRSFIANREGLVFAHMCGPPKSSSTNGAEALGLPRGDA